MASALEGILAGGITKYLADEDASDKLKGQIIDAVSRKLYEVEIPNEERTIKKIKGVKQAITTEYGKATADVFDNLGFFQSGDIADARKAIDGYLEKYNITGSGFRTNVEKLLKEQPEKYNQLYNRTLTGTRETALKDRISTVNNLFKDRSNIRDLLVSPTAPQTGVRGALFGDRITPSEVIPARGRLEEATKVQPEEIDSTMETPAELFGLQEVAATTGGLGPQFRLRLNDIIASASQGLGLKATFSQTEFGTQVTNIDKASQSEYQYVEEVATKLFAQNPSNPNYRLIPSAASNAVRVVNKASNDFLTSTNTLFQSKGLTANQQSAKDDTTFDTWLVNNTALLQTYATGSPALKRLIRDKYGAMEKNTQGYYYFFERYDSDLNKLQEK
jgi:hypothetical protein